MIDVIIPVFNRPEYTLCCLESISTTNAGIPIRTIIVDNASRKKTKEIIKTWIDSYPNWPDFNKHPDNMPISISLESNKGFAGAINAGLEKVTSDYCIILHNDTYVFENWAKHMYEAYIKDEDDTGVVIPRTNYANEGTPCLKALREEFEKIKPSNKERIEPEEVKKIINTLLPEGPNPILEKQLPNNLPTSFSPEIASFCMMVRTSLFKQYNKFDEEFWPRGYEDQFWFQELQQEGLSCIIANKAFVFHAGNITSDGPGFNFMEIMEKNSVLLKEKTRKRLEQRHQKK